MDDSVNQFSAPTNVKSKIITDPEKLLKHIRFSGTLGMVLGVLSGLLSLLLFIFSHHHVIVLAVDLVISGTYILLGAIIREQMDRARGAIIAMIVIMVVLGTASILLAHQLPGIVQIFYFFYLLADLKYMKRLKYQRINNLF